MNQAILVIGNGKSSVLQQTINILDDRNIDFIIYWDGKEELPKLESFYSKLFYVKNRQKIYWGTDTQVQAEHDVMEYAINLGRDYAFFHLISAKDIPLMDKEYFKNFFSKPCKGYIGFVPDVNQNIKNRINYYYPVRNINIREGAGQLLIKFFMKLNRFFRINRIDDRIQIEKGSNWFSIPQNLVKEILRYPNMNIFKHSYLADELYVQTILSRLKPKFSDVEMDDNGMAARLIDWERGNPYTFTKKDIGFLKSKVNKNYAFARKVEDAEIPKEIFK
ncbi:beta-1,6-N-acetylglucosaminyltransferase [Pediococcus acidilactici]|uniref:beta-1,6-N-acetylglucosaminyltransferase n=1 Tax=Pediococcus acidilactici TaxID=1254 RepID=UPI003B42BE1A